MRINKVFGFGIESVDYVFTKIIRLKFLRVSNLTIFSENPEKVVKK